MVFEEPHVDQLVELLGSPAPAAGILGETLASRGRSRIIDCGHGVSPLCGTAELAVPAFDHSAGPCSGISPVWALGGQLLRAGDLDLHVVACVAAGGAPRPGFIQAPLP